MATKFRIPVSIPERVWGGLELPEVVGNIRLIFVSIPERVWGGLELDGGEGGASGEDVSIPERVWGGLEPQGELTIGPHLGCFNP